MIEWNRNGQTNAVVATKPGTLGETTVVASPGWIVFSLTLWGLAGYGLYWLIKRS